MAMRMRLFGDGPALHPAGGEKRSGDRGGLRDGCDPGDPRILKQIREAGFSGVINFPTVGTLDGNFRQRLEDLGMGWEKEVEMIRTARKMDLFTMAYTFDPQEARAMAGADVDVIIAHLGLTTGGSLGSKRAVVLSEAVPRVQEILRAAKEVKGEVICLAHGGPISSPEDTEMIYRRTDAVGFLGASSIERIPVERAIQSATEAFKSKPLKGAGLKSWPPAESKASPE